MAGSQAPIYRDGPVWGRHHDWFGSRIRVFIIADVCLYREGLAIALTDRQPITVVGTSSDLTDCVSDVARVDPHIVLLDVGVPGGPDALASIRASLPEVMVVALAVREDPQNVLDWVEAGASAYVTRQASLDDLVVAVERAVRGEVACSPRIVASLFSRVAELAGDRRMNPERSGLTRRELEILELIEDGLSNKEIAGRLSVTLSTVKNHVHSILGKLQVSRRGEAAARVRRHRVP